MTKNERTRCALFTVLTCEWGPRSRRDIAISDSPHVADRLLSSKEGSFDRTTSYPWLTLTPGSGAT